MPSDARVLQRGQRVGGLARLRDGDDQRARVRHAVAVAVLARDLDLRRESRRSPRSSTRDQSRVVAGAAGEDQHRVDLQKTLRAVAEQLRGVIAGRRPRACRRPRAAARRSPSACSAGTGRARPRRCELHVCTSRSTGAAGASTTIHACPAAGRPRRLPRGRRSGRVTPASAIASEARKFSPSPTPTSSGEPMRARRPRGAARLAAEHGDRVGAVQRDAALHRLEQVAVVQCCRPGAR
jgi:hypothetical protein